MGSSGKCPHDHLVVHSADNGYDFIAVCADCGLRGEKTGKTPSEARERFNRARGRRPNMNTAAAPLRTSQMALLEGREEG